MRRAIALVLTTVLAGCTNQLAVRQAYLNRFIGQPEIALMQQLGVPSRNYEAGGVKYLAYDEHRVDIMPGLPTYGPFYTGWYGGGFPPTVIDLQCETTFEVAAGTVRSYSLRGNSCG
jgi:hypothetical protein